MGLSTALYTGVSGLISLSEALNVIGNNLANVDTPGYKESTARFETVFSQTLAGANPPTGGRLGTNPIQVGLGTKLASIDKNFAQGSLNGTGSVTDLAIEGRGFFILDDGAGPVYSRDGSFGLAIDGTLFDPATGFAVLGYLAVDGVVNTAGPLEHVVIPIGMSIAGATESATLAGNFDAAGDIATTETVLDGPAMLNGSGGPPPPALPAAGGATLLTDLYDALNNDFNLQPGDIITIEGLKGGAEISSTFTVGAASDLNALAAALESAFGIVDGIVTIEPGGFIRITGDPGIDNAITEVALSATSSDGTTQRTAFDAVYDPGPPTAFTEITAADGESYVLSSMTMYDSLGVEVPVTITFTRVGENSVRYLAESPFGTAVGDGTITFDENGLYVGVDNEFISIDRSGTGAEDPLNIALDFSGMTFYGGTNTLALYSQDGFPIGSLEDFSVRFDGLVSGSFSNGMTQTLGQIPLAIFPNQEGLTAMGNNLFNPSPNSGEVIVGVGGTAGRGTIAQAFLEGSNTDLGAEFVEIIVVQRGYQANARTITVADNLMEEVIGLVR